MLAFTAGSKGGRNHQVNRAHQQNITTFSSSFFTRNFPPQPTSVGYFSLMNSTDKTDETQWVAEQTDAARPCCEKAFDLMR